MLWTLLTLGLVTSLPPVPAPPVRAQGFGFGGEELKVVERFDKNGDGRLDAAERKPAREWLAGGGQSFGRRRFGFGGFAPQGNGTVAGRKLAPADVKAYPQAGLYDPSTLRTLFIQFDQADWEDELEAFYNTDVDVPATVTVDGAVYREVGVHFRGASSFRMVPEGVKRSLNLAFDFVHDAQRLHGYRTLNLLNGNGDPTMVRTVLYSEIARHYLPLPKTNYVRAVVNGESWGVFINAQQFNSDFTKEFYSSTNGARWKVPGTPRGRAGMEYLGEDLAPYRRLYEIKTKDTAKSWADLVNLFKVLNQTPLENLEAALAPVLDVDATLKFLAIEVALVNSDGYWTRASDYSIYESPDGRFHIVPHDVNEALSDESGFGFGSRGGGVTLDPLVSVDDPGKPLRSRLLKVPALRARYLAYVHDIAEKWLDWKAVEPLVTQYQALVADEMKVDTRKLYSFEAFQSGVTGLKAFIDRRRTYLLQATAKP
jgi:hypothetical protein